MKKKILFVGEASFISTGFSTLQFEIMKRLFASDKYILAEYSNYGRADDPRRNSLPWAFYSSCPENELEEKIYRSHPLNEFGSYKFEKIILQFKPDIVVSLLDFWMMSHLFNSPARYLYKLVVQPTCDAEPQKEEWIEAYTRADVVNTYSEWAFDLLKKQSNGKIPLRYVTSPAADYQVFKPVSNKSLHKSNFGMDPSKIIVGTVMRNQARKLYPNLLQDFRSYLDNHGGENVFLYLHTSPLDVGWNIPYFINKFNLSSKVLMTYVCQSCHSVYPNFYSDLQSHCLVCGQNSATTPTSQVGISREALANIMNLFDVYVQYSTSGGFEMPVLEAASCGIPTIVVNYSAMEDFPKKIDSVPINPIGFIYERETNCTRAIPDGNEFVDKLNILVNMPDALRQNIGQKSKNKVLKQYSWDDIATKYMEIFDEIEVVDKYKSSAQFHQPNLNIPEGLLKDSFVEWGIINIAGRPELLNTYLHMRMVRDLNWGYTLSNIGNDYISEFSIYHDRPKFTPFGYQEVVNFLLSLAEQKNQFESARSSL